MSLRLNLANARTVEWNIMRVFAAFLLALVLPAPLILAQDRSAPGRNSETTGSSETIAPERAPDAQAIGELLKAFIKAYNAKDAKALGALFTQNAEIEDEDGEITTGRDGIVARFAESFAGESTGTLSVTPESLRFLGADVAVEEGTAALSAAGDQPPRSNRYSVIYTREGGRWLHAKIRDEASDEPTPHERLSELSWMLGEWVNESDDATVFTTCTFSKDGNFLLREFDVKVEGRIALSGTQRVAWDAQQKQFRMWVFDTKGGFAEGVMFRDDDRWIIKAKGTRADGTSVTATNTITVLSKDRLHWESSDRTVGDTPVSGSDGFTLVRRAPVPGIGK
jgi:uncharacterized protein (TIGR02246 family)